MLRDDLGWEALKEHVQQPLSGLKVAPYYGCLLLRPQAEIGLDNPEEPRILHDCLAALGCEVVDFPYQVECCGSYLAVSKPELPEKLAKEILVSAQRHGAQAIVTACPLCQFNGFCTTRRIPGNTSIPVLYLARLMAVALGVSAAEWGMESHYIDPRSLFNERAVPLST